MPIVLYQLPASQPCRAVMMTAEHLGVQMVYKYLDLFAGEHMTPEFLAINPQHCVPTIDDDGFILWEGRAIQAYLVNKYAPDSPIYPKEPQARAVVDKMLYYSLGNLFKAMSELYFPILYKIRPAPPESYENFKKSLSILEKILETTPYVAGDHLTIADYSILSNLDFMEEVMDYSFSDYPKISCWLKKMKKESPKYKEINEVPLKEFKKLTHSPEFKELIKSRK